MAENVSSKEEKKEVKKIIKKCVRKRFESINSRREDWLITPDNNTSVFITFSKLHQGERYFYDIDWKDLEEWLNFRQAFVVFVMENHSKTLVIPVKRLNQLIGNLKGEEDSQIKLHIKYFGTNNHYEFEKVKSFNLSEFYNDYSQLDTEKMIGDKTIKSKLPISEPQYTEGWRIERFTNDPARDYQLRAAAIEHHGTKCKVCKFDFEAAYGKQGIGFIEVHHKRPISKLKGKTRIDPVKDLTVVCSNCHSMIHRYGDNPLSISKLKKMLRIKN